MIKRNRLRTIWYDMRQRCKQNGTPQTKNYGDRGISVCDEWKDFNVFSEWALAHGYDDSLTIDRIDSNGNYEPGNCRFVTYKEQSRNLCTNRYASVNGETKLLKDWCAIYGITPSTVYCRVRKEGWSFEKAITTPPQKAKTLNPARTEALYDKKRKPVVCVCDGDVIQEFTSLKDAERCGFVRSAIINAIKRQTMYRGFYWDWKG